MKINNAMTVAEVWGQMGLTDEDPWHDKIQALARTLAPDEQAFEDWLLGGVVGAEDTVGEIFDDWEGWLVDSDVDSDVDE